MRAGNAVSTIVVPSECPVENGQDHVLAGLVASPVACRSCASLILSVVYRRRVMSNRGSVHLRRLRDWLKRAVLDFECRNREDIRPRASNLAWRVIWVEDVEEVC